MKGTITLLGCLFWLAAGMPSFSEEPGPRSAVKALEEKYESLIEDEINQPHQAAIADLNRKYLESLDRARTAAQQRQKLDEALTLVKESDLIKKGTPVPAEDDPQIPTSLKTLRSIYRAALARLESERTQRLRPLKEKHIASLNAIMGQLTRQGKLLEAKEARDVLEKLQRDASENSRHETSLKELLPGTKWLWYGSPQNEMTFLPDGTIEFTEWTRKGLVTGWKVVGENRVRLTILKGRDYAKTATLEFADDHGSFTGTDFNGKAQIARSPIVPTTPPARDPPAVAPNPEATAAPNAGQPPSAKL